MILKKHNAISSGFRGLFDGQVMIRERKGQVELCKAPVKRPGKPTSGQQKARDRFTEANIYYRWVVAVPELEALYIQARTGHKTVQNLAISDFYHAPEIESINLDDYKGQPGDIITINATDNFCVHKVLVCIYDADNQLVEKGEALQQGDTEYWDYTALCQHAGGGRVEVTARDLPENETKVVVELAEVQNTERETPGTRFMNYLVRPLCDRVDRKCGLVDMSFDDRFMSKPG